MEENNWELASNSQLKEECERLTKDFEECKAVLLEALTKIEELREGMILMSEKYNKLQIILKRRGCVV